MEEATFWPIGSQKYLDSCHTAERKEEQVLTVLVL